MAYKVPRKEMNLTERLYLPAIWKGMMLTFRHFIKTLFRGGEATVRYPEKRRPIEPGYRGMHQLKSRPDGTERCVACEMCSTVCPSGAISIRAGEVTDPSVEKHPESYEIDLLRCIFCGMCVEACPKEAIDMTKLYELADTAREKFLVPRDRLQAIKDKE